MFVEAGSFSAQAVFLEPRFCPNRCGATILGKDFATDHLGHDCPLKLELCPHGCGERILHKDLIEHKDNCQMFLYRQRAEVAVRESATKELRLAIAACYEVRDRAEARMVARGEADIFKARSCKGWTSNVVARAIANLEVAFREVATRMRRKAKDRLLVVLAMGDTKSDGTADFTTNVLKFYDAVEENPQGQARGARPWDLQAPVLQPLLEALREAADCGENVPIRRQGEQTLMAVVRRYLEAAMMNKDNEEALVEALDTAQDALRVVELQSPVELLQLIAEAHAEMAHVRRLAIGAGPNFFEAVTQGDVELVSWLVDREKASPCVVDPKTGLPPLVVAAKAGDLPMCQALISRMANIDERTAADGMSALHWATHLRYARVQALLLASHANPRVQDRRGQDPLMKLLRRDFDGPAAGCAISWEGPLPGRQLEGPDLPVVSEREVAYSDLKEAMAMAEDETKCVGLCIRAEGGDGVARIEMRAAQGKARRRKDGDDEGLWSTYLKVAADALHDVRALLASGADPCGVDFRGYTPLHHHLMSAPGGGSPEVVSTLLRNSADANIADTTARAWTPLLFAVHARRADLVEVMIQEAFPPANLDIRTGDGISALQLAEERNAHKVAALLRDNGAVVWQDCEIRLGGSTFTFDTRTNETKLS